MATADEIRAQQRVMWDELSSAWGDHDAQLAAMLGPTAEAMISLLDDVDGDHLDVAAGSGEPGLTIAARAPQRHVVVSDLAPDMLDVAARRAAALGLTNVSTRECSADALPFDDATFGSVSCRFGLMFVPDMPGTVRELARVVAPAGRLVVAVWGEPPENAWATMVLEAVGEAVELPPADPDGPGLFRCASPGEVSTWFADAGLHAVTETDVHSTLDVGDGEEYWSFITSIAAPMINALAGVDDATRARVHDVVVAHAETFRTGDVLRIPLHARCVAGTKHVHDEETVRP